MTIAQIHFLFLESNGVCTDTRNIERDTIFFALKGEQFNGNTYAQQAIEQGASYAIVDEKEFAASKKHILVDNVLKTLQELSSFHRKYIKTPIIALTGSNGKTTTKELINAVLSTCYNTSATVGNLNNHIGVPLTLLSMTKETEIGIVEMGANHPEEIAFLCSIAKPDYGYITNIGKAHLEGFGSLEGVLQSKTELYRHLKKEGKLVFLNADDEKLTNAASGIDSYNFSAKKESDVIIKMLNANPMVIVQFKGVEIESNLIGVYNFSNISAAITIGNYFNISTEQIKEAITSYTPTNNRSQIVKKNGCTIILDAYNANPSSMEAAIVNFNQLDSKQESKMVFLGDMFELGAETSEEHQKIVNQIINTKISAIYLIGKNFFTTSTNDPRVQKHESYDDFANKSVLDFNNKTILIKGSRGMKLERILDLI